MLPLACLTLGVLLGLIGGLHVALALMHGLKQRLDEIECKPINNSGNNE